MKLLRKKSIRFKATLASFAALTAMSTWSAQPLRADIYTFNGTGSSGTWTTSGIWTDTTTMTTGAAYPNASGDVANVQANISANYILTLGAAITVGVINIGDTDGTNKYTVAAGTGGTLTFDNGGADAQLNQTATSAGDTISAPILIGGDGALVVSNASTANALTLSGAISSTPAGNSSNLLTINGAGAVNISGIISNGSGGTVGVTKSGNGTLTLSNANTFTGGLTMNAGTLVLSGANTYNGGTLLTGGTLAINNANALGVTASALTISGGSLDNTTLPTGTTVAAITLATNNAQFWNASFGYGGTQSLNLGTGAVTLGTNIVLTTNAVNPNSVLTVGGIIGDGGSAYSLTKAGAGTLTLSNANTYTGGTFLTAGTLNLNNASALSTGALTISGGTIDNVTGSTITLTPNENWNGSFAFGGTRSLTLTTGTVTLGNNITLTTNNLTNGTVFTVSDVIGGAFSLTKQGVGTLTLNANNTFSGGLTIGNGSVILGTTTATAGTNTITLGSATGGSASLLAPYGTAVTVANNITLASGAVGTLTLGGGGSPGAGVAANFTLNGGLTLNGQTLNINDSGVPQFANNNANGSVSLNGTISGAGGLNLGTTGSNIYSAGTTTIGGTNSSYTGTTTLLQGTLVVKNSGSALGTGTLVIGGGNTGTFNNATGFTPALPTLDATTSGLTLTITGETWNSDFSFTGTNSLNLGTGAVSLGTAAESGRLVSVAANTLTVGGAISNGTNGVTATTGLIKGGAGTLALNGANTYTGGTTINAGFLQFGAGAVPATGLITINNGGSLNINGAFTTAASALPSVSTASTGDLALTANDSTSINLTGYNNLMLGASGSANTYTYTGTITPATTGYHLGGGGGTLVLSNTDALTGNNNLTIGAVSVIGLPVGSLASSTLGTSTGTVRLTAPETMSGTTTINSGTLNLSGLANGFGSLANSAVTVNNGATLAFDSNTATGAPVTTRAASLSLYGGVFTDTSVTTANSVVTVDNITGALNLRSGGNTISVTANGIGGSNEVTAASLNLATGSFALVNGANLGRAVPGTNASSNIIFGTAPTTYFVGSTTQTTGGINAAQKNTAVIPQFVGSVTAATGGLGTLSATANTFLTYDTTTGLRPLNLTDEFTNNAITSGNNTYITGATTSGTTASINSLIVSGSTLTITDGTTLTNASGAMLFNTASAAATIAPSVSTGALAFGVNTAYINVNSANNGATINAPITGSGGLIKTGPGQLSLAGANTFTGTTVIQNGTLSLSSTGAFVSLPSANAIVLGDTGGNNSTTLRLSGSSGTYVFSNPLTVAGGNIGTATLLFPSTGVVDQYTGTVTLGSANAAGTVVGHNLTISMASGNTIAGVGFTGILQDPSGLTGPAGVVSIIEGTINANNGSSFQTFGNASSTYSGGTTIAYAGGSLGFAPFLKLTSGSIFGTGTLTINGMSLYPTSATTITGANNQVWNMDWVDSGTAALNWNMSGSIDLGNVASGTTRTLTNNGSSTLTVAGNIQNGSNGVTTNLATVGTIVLNGNSTHTTTTVLSGTLTASGTAGANYGSTGVGTTAVSGGTLLLGASNALYAGETVAVNGTNSAVSTFNLNGKTQTIGGLTGANTVFGVQTFGGIVTNNANTAGTTLTISGASPATATYAGAITDAFSGTNTNAALSLVKSGTSTQVLSGSNSYTGSTTINGGVLVASGTYVPASSPTVVTGSNSNIITIPAGTAGLTIGQKVGGNGVTTGSYITAITGPTTFTINNNVTNAATGTLSIASASSVGNTSGITVNPTGTLQLASANAIGLATAQGAGNGTATGVVPLTLAGGTLSRTGSGGAGSGTTVGVGMLTLTAASTLDFGTVGMGTINFASFSDSGNFVLSVTNYSATTNGTAAGMDGVDDRLIFNQNMSAFLGDFSINGTTPTQVALGNGEFELQAGAVPEPGTWVGGVFVLAALGWRFGRRRRAGVAC